MAVWVLTHELGNVSTMTTKTEIEYYEFTDAHTQAVAQLREGMKKYEDEPVIGDIFQTGTGDNRYISLSWTCQNTYPEQFEGLYIAHMITVKKKETESV